MNIGCWMFANTTMKKILLSAALGAISLGALAQVADQPIVMGARRYSEIYALPLQYTANNASYLVYLDGDYGSMAETIKIYDENLNVVKTISRSITTYEREETITYDGESPYTSHSTSYDYTEEPSLYSTEGVCYGAYMPITQTLFNSDEKFEYLVPIYRNTTYTITDYQRECKEEVKGYVCKGYKIISDDNTEVGSITINEEQVAYVQEAEIIVIGEKTYLLLRVKNTNGTSYDYYYAIDKETSSISETPVRMAMSVRPTVAKKNEVINVTLPEDSKASQLMVTSAAGQTIRRIPLKAGVSSYQVRTTGLASGMYVISVDEGGNKKEYCKVVIR